MAEITQRLHNSKIPDRLSQWSVGTNTGGSLWTSENTLFTVRVTVRLPMEIVESTSLEILETCLDMVLATVSMRPCLSQGWARWPLEVSSILSHPVILWSCECHKLHLCYETCWVLTRTRGHKGCRVIPLRPISPVTASLEIVARVSELSSLCGSNSTTRHWRTPFSSAPLGLISSSSGKPPAFTFKVCTWGKIHLLIITKQTWK